MFPFRSQFLYLLHHFFQLCCHSLSNLQEQFVKHEYRQQVKELGRGRRKITYEGEAELCHSSLGGRSGWDAISKYCDSFCTFCDFRQLSIANENCTENSNSFWGGFQDFKSEIHPDKEKGSKHCRILSQKKFCQDFFFPVLYSHLKSEVISKRKIKMSYLKENTAILWRCSPFFFFNIWENKHN